MSQVEAGAQVDQDILWSVIELDRKGEEVQTNFTTQREAQEFLFTAFSRDENAYHGITVVKNDVFIRWTDEQNYIDEELAEFDADSARDYFVGELASV